ncbi:MAG: starch-binding protein [Prevotella sp.]|nr:starch-binding protein [Prevotella sp.]
MNTKIYSLMLGLLTLTGLLTGCKSDEDITFDHERQQFETRADRILLEFIAPFGTTADEEIYITGAFNGEEEAVGNPQYLLTKAPNNNIKWGIYLDPSTFVGGKSLADGFRFYSKNQGKEFTTAGDEALHTDNPGVGTFTNIWGQRWESYYWSGGEAPEPEHDGFAVYVDDQTGWDVLTLYMWGDINNLNGDWPGMSVTGTWNHDGVTWKYFDMGEANNGLIENLIFNNGGAGIQLPDFNFTIERNVYLRITADGVEEIGLEPSVKHDGYAVFVYDDTGWDALNLYMWGDTNNLNGDWPGMEVTGEQTINGITYKYFDMGEANTGLGENLIFSNAGASQLADFAYTIDHDVYLHITTAGATEIDPATFQPGGETPTPAPGPDPEPQPTGETVIIAVKNSVGYANPHLYVWGDSEACGGWPGAAPVKVTDNGWSLFELPANGTFNLILNDNGSPQVDGPEVFTAGSHFYDVNAGWEESANTVTIQNNAGYNDPRLYAWGAGEIYGGWRGIKPTINENGTLVFPLPNDGGEYNLILNGEGDGVQQDIDTVIANQSYTFNAD